MYSKRILHPLVSVLAVLDLAPFHLGPMHAVEVFQEHIAEALTALVLGRVRTPGADGAGQAARHAALAGHFGDGLEVGADGEDDAAGAGEAAQALALAAEAVALGRRGFLPSAPARVLGDGEVVVFVPEAAAPGQVVVGLNEVVVPKHRVGRLHPPEEVFHPPPQLALVVRHATGQVDFGQGLAELVREAPEAGQKDAPREEVVLPVCPLEHDGDVVLNQSSDDLHRIGRQRQGEGEGFVRENIMDSGRGFAEERWVAFGEVRVASTNEFGASRLGSEGGEGRLTVLPKAPWRHRKPPERCGSIDRHAPESVLL